MDKKAKINLTNEEMRRKFKSSFDLVNYAIQLAENMIKTGREARVKSEIQNRAMLILEEIHEGKDQFDEIKTMTVSGSSTGELDGSIPQVMINEERLERRKYRTAEALDSED